MFPKSAWYVACMSQELLGKPIGRTICNEPLVLFRGPDAKVAALEDFCPHRGAPLSAGKICEGKLVCGYHGLEMGCDGKAVAMPNQRVRGLPSIRTYPVQERHGYVWVWPGDPALADADKVPHPIWSNNPDWAFAGGMYHIQSDFRLMIDNLMDLTHENYVHSNIGQREIEDTPCITRTENGQVVTSRFMNNVIAPPFWQHAMGINGFDPEQPVDRWQVCRFTPPSQVFIEIGVAVAGKGGYQAPDKFKTSSIVVDFITPETDTSMWYFFGMARNYCVDNDELTQHLLKAQYNIFSEDVAMLELQQKTLSTFPQKKLLMLNIDAGGVQSRKLIDTQISAENLQSSTDESVHREAVAT